MFWISKSYLKHESNHSDWIMLGREDFLKLPDDSDTSNDQADWLIIISNIYSETIEFSVSR